MPKISLRPIDKFASRIKANLNMIKGTKCNADLAAQCNVCPGTIRNRLIDPLDMTLREAYLLCEKNHIELCDFIGAELKLKA